VEIKKEEPKRVQLYPKFEDVVEEKVAPKVEVKVEVPKVEVVPSAPKEEEREEKFNIHYKILENMGFKDITVCTRLLKKHNGNLQKVVDELLSQ